MHSTGLYVYIFVHAWEEVETMACSYCIAPYLTTIVSILHRSDLTGDHSLLPPLHIQRRHRQADTDTNRWSAVLQQSESYTNSPLVTREGETGRVDMGHPHRWDLLSLLSTSLSAFSFVCVCGRNSYFVCVLHTTQYSLCPPPPLPLPHPTHKRVLYDII